MSSLELPPPPWIAGHRGAAGEACENTLAAFRRGRQAGADMLELDVQLTADGVAVCFHDRSLERLASRSEIIEEHPAATLIDVPLAKDGDRVPTLRAALDSLPEDLPLNVELKRYVAPRADLVRETLRVLDGRCQVLVSSFDWRLLAILRETAPDIPIAPLSAPSEIRALAVDPGGDLIAAGRDLGAFSLHCSRAMVERPFIELARRHGFDRMLSYTVNDPHEAKRFFDLGVAGIFTDVPSLMVARLRGRVGAEPSDGEEHPH